jgi:hypothetical protein
MPCRLNTGRDPAALESGIKPAQVIADRALRAAGTGRPSRSKPICASSSERITHNFSLTPLKPPDVANYIEFRLRAAGYHGPNPFSEQAVKLIAEISEGLSRRINILADKALLAAYSNGSHRVDSAEIRTGRPGCALFSAATKSRLQCQAAALGHRRRGSGGNPAQPGLWPRLAQRQIDGTGKRKTGGNRRNSGPRKNAANQGGST